MIAPPAAPFRRVRSTRRAPKPWRDWRNVGLWVRRILHKPPPRWYDRDSYVNRERVFAEEWNRENTITPGTDAVLDLLFILPTREGHRGARASRFRFDPTRPEFYRLAFGRGPSRRDRIVAATVVQWLGTNVGFAFLDECLRKCGYRIERDRKPGA